MEDKLKEVFDRHWKGFMSYDDYTKADRVRFTKDYNVDDFYKALKDAYNTGIEIAANHASADLETVDDPVVGEYQDAFVNRDSILDLQIE